MANLKGVKSDKLWRDQIRLAVNELRDDPDNGTKTKALRMLAKKLVSRALDGDMVAMKEIGDRLDGRPNQALTVEPGQSLLSILDELERRREMQTIDGVVIDDGATQLNGEDVHVTPDDMLVAHTDKPSIK